MSKIGLIISREYITRVRKKSFILMSLLGPLLIVDLDYLQRICQALKKKSMKF